MYLEGLDSSGSKDTPLVVDDMDNCEGEHEERGKQSPVIGFQLLILAAEIPIEYQCGLCKEYMWAPIT